MEKKVMSKQELLANRDQLIADAKATTRRFAKKPLLTKKERKVLGIGNDMATATAKYVRINPYKVNALIKLIRGKSLEEALAVVTYMQKSSSPVLFKLIKSAEANANYKSLNHDKLYIADAYANEAPTLKRIMPRAKGSATRILKRASHITVTLREKA